MDALTGNLHDIQAEIYNGLSGFYSPDQLLQECGGNVEEATSQIVDGAILAGMITSAAVVWNGPDGVQREMNCYELVTGYLERV